MITYDKTEIGSYYYTNTRNNEKYRVSIRSGNCAGVHIYTYKDKKDGERYNQLVNFVADNEHLKNMAKNGYDLFEDCKEIRLNMYFAQNIKLMMYAVKFGHKVNCYYKEI